ncbi:hypothetical protein [Halobellus litoreus]|uniref:Uncharacterized protein n=1 Tax=Halobellus litoreus TaxID=755310 RepID=A0ABD6DVP6_9EURY|nr:hypothetical protein [Halobellus litoreus]
MEVTPERARKSLKGQLHECEDRIAIYRDLLADAPDIKTKWAIKDAIEAMREHRVTIEQALDDHSH